METLSQKKANRRWRRKNKKKDRIYSYRSTAKRFINFYSTKKDLNVLKKLIYKREKNLK